MKWIRRICIGLLALLAIGWAYEFIGAQVEQWKTPSSPGRLVDIGGYRLHILEMGGGDATVILDAGMTMCSLDWALVQPEIAKFARVCSYDRAGLGWSDESPHPRTAEQIVTELHELLIKAEVPKPYILVGHSMGGIHQRLYASRYPEEVAGLVLVDASHEEMMQRLPPDPIWEAGKQNRLLAAFCSHFGINRLFLKVPHVKQFLRQFYQAYPPSIAETYLSINTTSKSLKTATRESEACDESLEQIKKYPSSLGNKPLVVITAGALSFLGEEVGYTKKWMNETYEGWKVLQKELAGLSSQSRQVIAERSDHLIPRRQPEIIVQAVREVIQMTQDGQD